MDEGWLESVRDVFLFDGTIVVLREGEVEEAGTHASLLASGRGYARFWRDRGRSGVWRLLAAGAAPRAGAGG